MTEYVEVRLPGDASLIVERRGEGGVVRAGRVQRVADSTGESFESAIERVKAAALVARDQLFATRPAPDEIVVEFAITVGAELGVVIANSSVEANLKVAVRWSGPGEGP